MSKGKQSQNVKQVIMRRSIVASVCVSIFALAIISRLIFVQYYQTYKGKLWKERISGVRIKKETIPASRGNIYAADGSLLATSLPYYRVSFDPCAILDTNVYVKYTPIAAAQFANYFKDANAKEYQAAFDRVRRAGKRYVRIPLKRQKIITFEEKQAMQNWPFFRRDTIYNKAEIARAKKEGGKIPAPLRLIGGRFDVVYQRYKPFGNMALRTVGYLDAKKGAGLVGLEASFQKELAGKNGVGLVKTLSHGYKMPVEDGSDIKPEAGMDIHTTLDVNFQDIAEATLRDSLIRHKADRGSVIIMDVQTGAIKAMANLTNVKGNYVEVLNYALAYATDPGSTFKLATMMALLEDKVIKPSDVFETGDGTKRFGSPFGDAARKGYGKLTAQQIFEKSSNIGIHLMMKRRFYSQPERYCKYLHQFKLTSKTGFHMKGEASPYIKTPGSRGWRRKALEYMATGYEMQITPLQMLTFYNAVANDGQWVRPQIVRQIRRGNEVIEDYPPYIDPNPIASDQTIRQAQRMMEGVVSHGTAARAMRGAPYRIAGKTGTAQKIIDRQYKSGLYYTSFIGYFPANAPRYSMLVMVDSPRGENVDLLMGGAVSAPIFRAIADRIYAYDATMHKPAHPPRPTGQEIGPIAGLSSDIQTISNVVKLPSQPEFGGWVRTETGRRWQEQYSKSRVPDLRGMTLRDALYMLENRGFVVRFEGVGKVVNQSVPAGSPLPKPRRIILTLRPTTQPDSLELKRNLLPANTPLVVRKQTPDKKLHAIN